MEFEPVGISTVFPRIVSAENYSFLILSLCTVTFDHSTYRCGNYSREETIQGRKLFSGNTVSILLPTQIITTNLNENICF